MSRFFFTPLMEKNQKKKASDMKRILLTILASFLLVFSSSAFASGLPDDCLKLLPNSNQLAGSRVLATLCDMSTLGEVEYAFAAYSHQTQEWRIINGWSLNRKAIFSSEVAGAYIITGFVRSADGILIQSNITMFLDCMPSMEICDGLDNDCNGIVDEGCECTTNTDCNLSWVCLQGLCTPMPDELGL